ALGAMRAAAGRRHPDVANLLNTLGRLLYERGAHGPARAAHGEALAIADAALRLRALRRHAVLDRIRVQAAAGVAHPLRALGRRAEAEQVYREATRKARRALGAADLELGWLLNARGVLCKDTGAFARGRRFYLRALAIVEAALGPRHPDVATIYHNLGGI